MRIVAVAAGDHQCAVNNIRYAGIVCIRKACAVGSACPGSCADIDAVSCLTGDPHIGNCNGMPVRCIAVGKLVIPLRSSKDRKAKTG